ncbi:hypothetical protein D3C87_33720 [compost metagenome]
MEVQETLSNFFLRIAKDERISSTHIAVFVALIQYSVNNEFKNPILAFNNEIRSLVKLSHKTCGKCVRDLSDYGYIKYEPSFKRTRGSRIHIY